MSDDEDDPFADFEKPDDDSDPFAELGSEEPTSERGEDGEQTGDADPAAPFEEETDPGRLPDDPFTNRDADRPDRAPESESRTGSAGPEDTSSTQDATSDDPDGDLGSVVREDSTSESGDETDPFADLGGGPQPRTRGDDEGEDPFESFESVDVGGVDVDEIWSNLSSMDDAAEQFEGKVYYEVSKHRFCEQCPHFSGPPETQCTFEGAEIVEFVDMETVRVVNCPVVAEQEDLGEDVTRYEPE